MTYLLRYLPRAPIPAPRRPLYHADEHTLLNRPGYYAEAYVHIAVEDTSTRKVRRRGQLPHPRLVLEIADCVNHIRLEFELSEPGVRENSLFKIETLIGALERFRDGLAAEAELYAQRERARELRLPQPV